MATTGTGQGSPGVGTTDWSTSAGQVGQQTSDRRPAGDTGASASGISQTLKDSTYRSIDDQKSRASETLGSLAGAVRGMTQPLREGGQPQIADYVNKAADGIERWASQLRQQDLEDAVRAVEQFARRQPAMFLGVAFGAGLIAARFLKSSNREGGTRQYGGNFDSGAGGPSGLRSADYTTGQYGGAQFGTTGTSSGDIPRVGSDIRPAGEVL
jgi:hypothetical protein